MSKFHKIGGVVAIIEAVTYVVGMAFFVTILAPYVSSSLVAIDKVAFLVANQALMYICNLIIYIVFGVLLVILTLALDSILREKSPALSRVASAFGLIWAGLVLASGMVFNVGCLGTVVELYADDPTLAASVWLSVAAIQDGLGGGNEIVGGIWVLLVSWAALRSGIFPKAVNVLGLVISAAGLLTVIPVLADLGAVFGLLQIVWFVWLGILMLRD